VKIRSSFRNRAEYVGVRFLFGLLQRLPDRISHGVARAATGFLQVLVPRLSQVAMRNLTLTMPYLDAQRRRQIIRGVFKSIARLLWVIAKTSSTTRTNNSNVLLLQDKYFRIENLQVVHDAYRQRKGILFATGHIGAWELSALGFGAAVNPMDVIARQLDNPLLDRWICGLREASGNRILAKSGTLREVMRALGENRAVGFLVDHNVISSDLCFIHFLGVEASASTVFAKLAARTGAVVIPGFCLWEDAEHRFVLRFYPPVAISGNAVQDTQNIHASLERVVRLYPDQWLWIHRRFKTRPPGHQDLYANLKQRVDERLEL